MRRYFSPGFAISLASAWRSSEMTLPCEKHRNARTKSSAVSGVT